MRVAALILLSMGLAPPLRAQVCDTDIVTSELPNSDTNVPVDIRNANDDRLFIVEQAGQIRVYKHGAILSTPFLDIRDIVACCGERGLLSLAFHPDYPDVPYFYVYYTNEDTNTSGLGDV